MSEFTVGQILDDVALIDQLPVGTIIAWGEPGDEDVGIVQEYGSHRSLENTAVYYFTEPHVVTPPYTIIRLGRGEA
jgi:hypothetical protein